MKAKINVTVLCPNCGMPLHRRGKADGRVVIVCISPPCDLKGKEFEEPTVELTPAK